ncbi:MAG: hypothetical protein ACYCYP_11305 [Leptospirales bacterium]
MFAIISGETLGFISPAGFLFMHLFQGVGWILLLAMASVGGTWGSAISFAVIHAFGLGFLSLAVLSVLVHVLPAACHIPVGGKLSDRWHIGVVIFGTALVVSGFGLENFRLSLAGALLIFVSILFTVLRVSYELLKGSESWKMEPWILGLMILGSLIFFLSGISLGTFMLYHFLFPPLPPSFEFLPIVHATLMVAGWLALIVTTVFSRTSGPLLGFTVPFRRACAAWGAMAMGILLVGIGLLAHDRSVWISAFSVSIIVFLLYNGSLIPFIFRSHPVNPVPRRYLISSVFYSMTGASILVLFVLLKLPVATMGVLFIFLMGWLGQFLIAHLYHLGPRLLSLLQQGTNDLTPPIALLEMRRSLLTFFLYQAGIGLSTLTLLFQRSFSTEAAIWGPIFGILAWTSLSFEIGSAWKKARRTSAGQHLFTPMVK